MTLFYTAPEGELGSLAQALREARMLVAALEDPKAAALIVQMAPEHVAAVRQVEPLREAEPPMPLKQCTLVANANDGRLGLAIQEDD